MIKTVTLTGKEVKVQNLGGFNTVVHNLGGKVIYASKYPNIIAGADNVAEIPANGAKLISTTNGTVYLLGVGKAELTGQDHDGVNFKLPSSLGGGGASDVTKAYVDEMLLEKFDAAKGYTDTAIGLVNDDIANLRIDKADRSEIPTTLPANGGNADTVNSHTVNADVPADAKFSDTVYTLPKATKTELGGVKIGDNLSVTADGLLSVPLALRAKNEVAGKDLNNYKTPGVYYFASDKTPTNIPAGVNGFLMVLADKDGRVKQMWFRQGTLDSNDWQTYVRTGLGDDWSSWRQLMTNVDRVTVGQKAGSAIGSRATSEGHNTVASGECSHAQGYATVSSGDNSCAEGCAAIASGNHSHAQGFYSTASGNSSYAEGKYTSATENATHAQGWGSAATGANASAVGDRTLATVNHSFVIGRLNATKQNSPFIIGGGSGGHTDLADFTPTASVSYNDYGRQGATLKNVFRVDNAGSVYGVGAFNTSGADYAEYIKPWFDDNINNEDRRGYFVTVKNGKLYKAEPSDYIVGITSGNPSVIGNGDEDWLGRWQRDEFNELVYEDVEVDDYEEQEDENGNLTAVKVGSHFEKHTVEVPEYDPTKEYIERKDRPEWSCVGMIGVLPLRDDGTCAAGGFAKCGAGGIATAADTWDCHKTFFVIERVNDHIISVEMR